MMASVSRTGSGTGRCSTKKMLLHPRGLFFFICLWVFIGHVHLVLNHDDYDNSSHSHSHWMAMSSPRTPRAMETTSFVLEGGQKRKQYSNSHSYAARKTRTSTSATATASKQQHRGAQKNKKTSDADADAVGGPSEVIAGGGRAKAAQAQAQAQAQGMHQQQPASARPPRVFLGINSDVDKMSRLAYRHQVRTTYLKFDSLFSFQNSTNTSTPKNHHRICSLHEFAVKHQSKDDHEWGPYECQLVYTFLIGAGGKKINKKLVSPSQWRSRSAASPHGDNVLRRNTPEEKSLLEDLLRENFKERQFLELMNNQHTDEYTFLNTHESYNPYKIWSWHQYALHHWKGSFDYIAHTSVDVMLLPGEFWRNEIFTSEEKSSSSSSSLSSGAGNSSGLIHGGYYAPKFGVKEKERFTLLSHSLLELLQRAAPEETYGASDPAVVFSTFNENITSVQLKGIVAFSRQTWVFGNNLILQAWDKYKDSLVRANGGYVPDPKDVALVEASNATRYFSDKAKQIPGPRVLLGIFSMDSIKEKERRAAVRSTYLSHYKNHNHHHDHHDDDTPNRICSLQELLRGTVPNNGADCQMAYAFVMGSNPTGPTELLAPNSTFPITVVPGRNGRSPAEDDEDDIVHLNIRENMEDGKSPTWFKYATTVNGSPVYFDYVAKTDTDTLVYPDRYLDDTLTKNLPAFPDNIRVFGGRFCIDSSHLVKMVGPGYYAGEFYWMSSDLARFVSSSELDNRKVLDTGIEDHAMSNFVHSHPLPIHRVHVDFPTVYFHPLKDVNMYLHQWRNYTINDATESVV